MLCNVCRDKIISVYVGVDFVRNGRFEKITKYKISLYKMYERPVDPTTLRYCILRVLGVQSPEFYIFKTCAIYLYIGILYYIRSVRSHNGLRSVLKKGGKTKKKNRLWL